LNVHSYWRLLIVAVPAVGLWFGYRWAWWGGLAIALVWTILSIGALSVFVLGAHRDPQRLTFARIAARDVLLIGAALILLLLPSSRNAIR
jgi:hypothetical protein